MAVDLDRCPTCRAPGAGPFVHRGHVHGVCDVHRLRWPLTLTVRDVARLCALRLAYSAGDGAGPVS